MNEYDKELLKNAPSMIKGIAVQAEHLSGNRSMSLSLNDFYGMAQFGLALGGQISEAEKTSTGKVIAEGIIGCTLFGCFIGLLASNIANRILDKQNQTAICSIGYDETKVQIEELDRLYHTHKYHDFPRQQRLIP